MTETTTHAILAWVELYQHYKRMTERDETDYDEGQEHEHDDRTANQRMCHECNRETAGEYCGFCGNDLCPMCFECGGGFCSAVHTQEQIAAYEDEVYPPKTFHEACERKRQRAARDDLKKIRD